MSTYVPYRLGQFLSQKEEERKIFISHFYVSRSGLFVRFNNEPNYERLLEYDDVLLEGAHYVFENNPRAVLLYLDKVVQHERIDWDAYNTLYVLVGGDRMERTGTFNVPVVLNRHTYIVCRGKDVFLSDVLDGKTIKIGTLNVPMGTVLQPMYEQKFEAGDVLFVGKKGLLSGNDLVLLWEYNIPSKLFLKGVRV